MSFRVEKDPLGKKNVPKNALYGIHTQRAKENFRISGKTLNLDIFYSIAEIKIAAAKANVELKILSRRKGSVIVRAAGEILKGRLDKEFVVDAFQAGAGTPTHMNVNEVIANRAIEILKGKKGNYSLIHPNDDVNAGQSTNNVVPSAVKIVSVKKLNQLLPVLGSLNSGLTKKSREFASFMKTGRTHLQDAVPISLGQEFHAYATSIEENITRIKRSLGVMKGLNIGKNAIGTGINTPPSFSRIILKHLKQVNKIQWKLSKDPIYATQSYTDFLEVSQNLKLLAVDLLKIADDLILLSSGPNTGLKEIKLPAVEPGSSIMPGKINPSMAEMIKMVCFQVIGNNETISEAAREGQLELNVMMPLIGRNLIESIEILTNGVDSFNKRCIREIKADREICRYYLEHSAGLATVLNPYIGYDKAAEIVKESLKTGKNIKEIILKRKLMGRKQLEKILKGK